MGISLTRNQTCKVEGKNPFLAERERERARERERVLKRQWHNDGF